jgi:putative ABC transport system permease protein
MVVEAARGCLANPLRSALGALAIAVAVGTMALVVTGLDGFARYAQRASARAFGSDAFVLARVTTSDVSRKELADRLARNRPVTRSDVRFLERYAAGQVLYAPVAQRRADVTAGGRRFENASVNGTAAALFDIRDLGIDRGRFIRRDEEDRAAQVAVIGMDIADALFPGVDPLGKTVRVGGRGFEVVGTQARQGTSGGVSLDRYAWIPLQAYERTFGAPETLQVFAKGSDPERLGVAEDRVRTTMRARRQLPPGKPDTFDILTPEAARGFVQRLSERISAAAAPISIMALFAAVVVVTNTTLVSVTQRTREIGVRRALGASDGRISAMLLGQGARQLGVGALIALPLLLAIGWFSSLFLPISFALSVATAFGVSATITLIVLAATWLPTRRAIAIAPRDALWRE